MSPSAINSPRRSRGLLIARGRGELFFNVATGGAINTATSNTQIIPFLTINLCVRLAVNYM